MRSSIRYEELRAVTPAFFELFCEWNRDYVFDEALLAGTFAQLTAYRSHVVAAWDGDQAAGYVQVTPRLQLGFVPYLEIEQLLVAERYRQRGIGAALVAEAERLARAAGIARIKLESEISKSGAHVFYEKLGFGYSKASKFYEKTLF
jgi:ribosomal protein S18 acetylase RimI-like enzyme